MHSRDLLTAAAGHAADFLETLPDGRVGADVLDVDALRAGLAIPLPDGPTDPRTVLDELVAAATPGIVRSQSPRYFGYVIGGALPAAMAADVVAVGWDQNAGGYSVSPASSVVEEVAGAWLIDLLGLPAGASFGLTTGCQQAHVTCLAAARNAVLAGAGWDAEVGGLQGAPRVRLLVSEERHVTIDRAARHPRLRHRRPGGGRGRRAGRMDPPRCAPSSPPATARRSCAPRPGTSTAAASIHWTRSSRPGMPRAHGSTSTGRSACGPPPARSIAPARRLRRRRLVGHRRPQVAQRAPRLRPGLRRRPAAAPRGDGRQRRLPARLREGERDGSRWVPDFSRRARGFAVYAALRSLGRDGVAELVERCCACARRFAEVLGADAGVEVLNDVVLNQVLVRFGDDDAITDAVVPPSRTRAAAG